jgi:hypothetical protein
MFVLYQANILTTEVIISANIPFLLLVSLVLSQHARSNEEYHETRNINLIFCSLQQTTHGIAALAGQTSHSCKKVLFFISYDNVPET